MRATRRPWRLSRQSCASETHISAVRSIVHPVPAPGADVGGNGLQNTWVLCQRNGEGGIDGRVLASQAPGTRKVDSWLPHSLGLYSLSRFPGGLPIREEQTQISRTVRSEDLVVEKLHISSGCSRHQTKWSIPLLFASLIHINLVDEHPERQLLKPDISHQPRPKRTMAGNTNPKADRLSVPERSRPDTRGNPEDALSLQVYVDGTSNRYANTQACLG